MWYYLLAEAKTTTDGLHLGPVGGRIVAETLIGLLRADPASYLTVQPDFQPFLSSELGLGSTPTPTSPATGTYTRAYFLRYPGVANPGVCR